MTPRPILQLAVPPAVVIRLPLEGPPTVRLNVAHWADRERLLDWVFAQPVLAAIVADAEDASRAWDRGELPRRTA